MITEKFSKKEQKKINKALKLYGAIKDCSDKTGVHRCTISRVMKTGVASEPIALKLRNYIDGFRSRLFLEEAA